MPVTSRRRVAEAASSPSAATRGRQLRRGVGAGLVYRITSAAAPLLLVPLALSSLGKEGYAIWMLATGLTSLFAFADLGLGNTLMSRVALLQAGESTADRIRGLTSSAYVALATIAAALWAVTMAVIASGEWRSIFNVPHASSTDAWILAITATAFLINIPGSLLHRMLFGMQRVDQSYYWQSAGPVLTLGLAVALPAILPSPSSFVLGVASGPVIVNFAGSVWYYTRALRHVRPQLTIPSRHDLRDLFSSGTAFLVISVCMAASTAMDTFLLPHFVDLERVADFSVVWRVFAQVGMVLSLMSLPFWPIAADALARGDVSWVKRTLMRMQVANFAVMSLVAVAAVALGGMILDLWLGGRIATDRTLLAGFSVWWLLQAITYPLFMVQNAVVEVKIQMFCWLAYLVTAGALKTAVLSWMPDPSLLPWISSILYVLLLVPCAYFVTRGVLRNADLIQQKP